MVFAIQSLKSSLVIMAMLSSSSLLSPSVAASASYTQLGPDFSGNATDEYFGSSVSMSDDGAAFVVGAKGAHGFKGAVRVFQKDPNVTGMVSYIQVGEDIVGKERNSYFGSSVSMSGDGTRFVVGALGSYRDDNNYVPKGSVSVYKFNTINCDQVGEDIVGKVSDIEFGTSVGMSDDGTSFVVGAVGSNNYNGSLSVYKQDTTNGDYIQVGSDIVGKERNVRFGTSVSMSGDGTSFVAGASNSNNRNGSVSVYKYSNDTSNFTQVGLDIVGKATNDGLGWSVSMSGDGTSFVAGAPYSNINKGSVSVYKYNNDTSNYDQVGADIVGNAKDLFGTSVSMSGDGTSFAVGAIRRVESNTEEESTLSNSGLVRVYKKSSTNGSYDIVGADIVGVNNGDEFGTSVSMSGNGATVVVEAPKNDNVNDENSGQVRLYRDTTASTRVPTTTPTSVPTAAPTKAPSAVPTKTPTASPTEAPTSAPTSAPSAVPTKAPTVAPTRVPTAAPTKAPTTSPTRLPTTAPIKTPTASPTKAPRAAPTKAPVFVISPTETPITSNENCGFFGWNLFCPRSDKCGFVKRLLKLGDCS